MIEINTARFVFVEASIEGVWHIRRKSIADSRGYFSRFWCEQEFAKVGWQKPVVQMNHTFTRQKGAVRGMHFQYPPFSEMKLVTCIQGEVHDVVVDLRSGSNTYLKTFSVGLSADEKNSLLLPEGVAHGFQTLTQDCEMIYLHTNVFSKEYEGAINIHDPAIAIQWPLEITEMSERDEQHPFIDEKFIGISI